MSRLCFRRGVEFRPLFFLLLMALAFGNNLAAAPRSTISSGATLTTLDNGSFEVPNLNAGQHWYRPPGAGWTFVLNSGIAENTSLFTRLNPAAPDGDQVLFLQNTGRISRPINLPPGTYRLKMRAAQRMRFVPNNQTFTVRVGGQTVATIQPTNTQYGTYYTANFQVVTGNELVELEGLNPGGGDNTAFVDLIQAESQGLLLWSASSSWVGGIKPVPGDDVTITGPASMLLDENVDVATLTINGKLYADRSQSLNLSAKRILVEGAGSLLEWGSEQDPYLRRGIITLTGSNPNDSIVGPGAKFLVARSGGTVEIHGAPRLSWTQLSQTVNQNERSIRVKEAVDWEKGDEIVIASTDFEARQAEKWTITDISVDKRTLHLSGNMAYMHFGALQSFSNTSRSFTLDERAEVALLSRNITIQGDASSETNGFGGHTMFMPTATVHISGVEFYRMGQRKRIARYPFHWHIAGNVPGQYIKNSSIHRSFNRVVVVHQTNDALVEDVVGYDHVGHGFFLESGNERRNTFRNNLGILTKMPAPNEQLTPHDAVPALRGLIKLPATFWITNPDNNFIGNVAAGSDGSGFWMTAQQTPILPAVGAAPFKLPMGQFDDNVAHSNSFSNFAIDGRVHESTQEFTTGHYRPQVSASVQSIPIIRRFTGYKCRERNIWMRANTMRFQDCSLADSPRNTFFAYNQILENSLVVGKSDNIGNPVTNQEVIFAGRSLGLPNTSWTHNWNIFSGHTIYDGPSGIDGVHFARFSDKNGQAIRHNGAAVKSPVHWAKNITWEAGMEDSNRVEFGFNSYPEYMYSSGLLDLDGSICGVPGGKITPKVIPPPNNTKIREGEFNHEPGATLVPEWNAYITEDEKYGLVELRAGWAQNTGTPMYNMRHQGSDAFAIYGGGFRRWYNQSVVIMNDLSYRYDWQYHKIPYEIKSYLEFCDAGDYMISAFRNMSSFTKVYNNNGALLPQASSLAALQSSATQKYFMQDNTIYVKHIASTSTSNYKWQHGYDLTDRSIAVKLCQQANCANRTLRTDGVTFADFELGSDSRMVSFGQNNLPNPTLIFSTNPTSGLTNGIDDFVRWTMSGDGDGINEYAQMTFNFPRQVWNEFQYMELDYSGPAFTLFVRDASQNFINMGTYTPGIGKTLVSLDPANNAAYLDEVVKVIVRVHESSLGPLNQTPSATITVRDIKLYMDNPSGSLSKAMPAPGAEAGLALYPNPTRGNFSLEMPFAQADVLTAEVYDLQGQLVLREQAEVAPGLWKQDFALPQLPRGMYKVVVRTAAHGIHSQNLVLQ